MSAYRQTFRRHRRLLSLPIVLATFMALWSVAGSAKSYQSNATLWVDTGPAVQSSVANANPAMPSPAEQEQSVLTELLKTRDFTLAVGRQGPLGKYLASHPGGGWGPTSMLGSLRGAAPLDARILSSLSAKHIMTLMAGPQVLQVSYIGPTPAVATGTLKTLLDELEQQTIRLSQSRGRQTAAFYRNQLNSAQKAVSDARDQVTAYLAEHPGAVGAKDPMLRALRQAQGQATARLARATTQFNLASGALKSPTTSASTIEVLDEPSVPTGPASGKKKAVVAVIGGLFAGALISFLGAVALTPSRPELTPESNGHSNGFAAEPHAPNGALPLWTSADGDREVSEHEHESRGERPVDAHGNGHPAREAENGSPARAHADHAPAEVKQDGAKPRLSRRGWTRNG